MSSVSEESSQEESGIGELRIQDVRSVPETALGVEFRIKSEPVDPSYDMAILGDSSVSEQINQQLTNEVWSNVASSLSTGKASSRSSGSQTSKSKVPSSDMKSFIDGLLLKNEYLLSQNDASCFKPYSRAYRHRHLNSEAQSARAVVDGESVSFYDLPAAVPSTSNNKRVPSAPTAPVAPSVGPVASTNGETTATVQAPGRDPASHLTGLILKPRCPTRRCKIPQKDQSHFSLALLESKVTDPSSNEIFHVQKHEVVCAVACNTLMINPEKTVVAQFDTKYFWCNFCHFNTAHKDALLTHIMEHRFHCKHCRYQSFSRADVIHHSSSTHPTFFNTAAVLNYCTLLPDYLQVTSQREDGNSLQEREQQQQPEGSSVEARGIKREPVEDADGMPAAKTAKTNAVMSITLQAKELEEDFEAFDMVVDYNGSEEPLTGQISERRCALAESSQMKSQFANTFPNIANILREEAGTSSSSMEASSPPPLLIALAPSPPPGAVLKNRAAVVQTSSTAGDSSATAPDLAPIVGKSAGQVPLTSKTSSSKSPAVSSSEQQHRLASSDFHGCAPESSMKSSPGLAVSSTVSSCASNSVSRPKSHAAKTSSSSGRNNLLRISPSSSRSQSRRAWVASGEESPADEKASSTSSNLLWRCGYCNHKSSTQTEIKHHSAMAHSGKPKRFVALIEPSTSEPVAPGRHSTRRTRAERDNSSDNGSLDFSAGDKDSCLPSSEECDAEIDVVEISPKTQRGRGKFVTSFRCYHCKYVAKRLGVMKNHILNTHRGLCLVGVDLNSSTGKALVCFCPRNDCRFYTDNGAKYRKHVNSCAPWNLKDSMDVKVEDHLLVSLKETLRFSQMPSDLTEESAEGMN